MSSNADSGGGAAAAGPVWAKRVGAVGDHNIAYCAGRDVASRPACDHALAVHDLDTNAAHVLMLGEAGAIKPQEASALLGALVQLRARALAGEDLVRPHAEDIHMSIEVAVGELVGPVAGRMHSGRSRNDQVATDMALWLRGRVAERAEEAMRLAGTIAMRAHEEAETPIPGLTHQQPAMVTTFGHWLASYLPRLSRVVGQWRGFLIELEECPLGAAAGFGTSWPIDRERTAELLGFTRPSHNSMDTVWRRGEFEARHAFLLSQLLGSLSGIGEDLMLLSSPPRAWIRLDDASVTGSSIMPQKRNPDFAEVTRAKAAVVSGILQSLLAIGARAVAGYNRQSQWTKYLAMDADAEAAGACDLFAAALAGMQVRRAEMRDACTRGFMNAADCADLLSRTRSLPFRETYRLLGAIVAASEAKGAIDFDKLDQALAESGIEPLDRAERLALSEPENLVQARRHAGGPRPDDVHESVERVLEELMENSAAIAEASRRWEVSRKLLWDLAAKRAAAWDAPAPKD